MHDRLIYLDHSATTAVDPRVVDAMMPFFTERYGNPSSAYRFAGRSKSALDDARETVAGVLGARPSEVVFTSCGTESDNLALRGVAMALRERGRHIITIPIEHHAVERTCMDLADRHGFRVTMLPVDKYGWVDPDDVRRAITDDTILVSIMYANNEVGTIEPIAEIGRIARERGVVMHTDAVQAGGLLDLDVDRLNVDLLSLSGHKFYAPKGVGVLYIRDGTPLVAAQTGGSQEGGRRAGTENVPYIVGLARALEIAQSERGAESARLEALRDELIDGVLAEIPDVHLTGHPEFRLPNHASFVFEGVEGEATLLQLDLHGIAASSGSACAAGDEEPSHVLSAMGVEPRLALSSLRLTLGRENTQADVQTVLGLLPEIVRKLRVLSPLYPAADVPRP